MSMKARDLKLIRTIQWPSITTTLNNHLHTPPPPFLLLRQQDKPESFPIKGIYPILGMCNSTTQLNLLKKKKTKTISFNSLSIQVNSTINKFKNPDEKQ